MYVRFIYKDNEIVNVSVINDIGSPTPKHGTSKRQLSADERTPPIQLQFHPAVGP